jgi:hypothetical protein
VASDRFVAVLTDFLATTEKERAPRPSLHEILSAEA